LSRNFVRQEAISRPQFISFGGHQIRVAPFGPAGARHRCQNGEIQIPNPPVSTRKALDFIGYFGRKVYWALCRILARRGSRAGAQRWSDCGRALGQGFHADRKVWIATPLGTATSKKRRKPAVGTSWSRFTHAGRGLRGDRRCGLARRWFCAPWRGSWKLTAGRDEWCKGGPAPWRACRGDVGGRPIEKTIINKGLSGMSGVLEVFFKKSTCEKKLNKNHYHLP
jgi:hypothetical protein